MAVVATGYVRIRVLSAGLENDIRDAVQRAVGKMDRDMQQQGRRLGAQMRSGIRDGLRNGDGGVDEAAEQVGERAGARVVRGTERNVRRNVGPALGRAFRTGTRNAEGDIASSFDRLAGRVGGRVARMFGGRFTSRAFGAIAGSLNGILGGIKAYIKPEIVSWFAAVGMALTTQIVPALAWIGGNAARGIGILSAGFSSLVVSAGLFAIALTRDTEQMKAFKEQWTELADIIGKPIQEEFLNRTEAGMGRLKTLAQQLEPEFRDLGAAWGEAFDQLTVMLDTDSALERIQRILRTSAKTTRDFGTATTNVVDAFLTLLAHAEPLVNYVSEGAVKMSEWAKNTLDAKAASGELDRSMAKVLDKWKQTWQTIKDFGEGIRNVFRAAAPVTEKFGDSMSRIAAKFVEWTGNPANQERMTAFFEKASRISGRVADILGEVASKAGRAFEKMDESKIQRVLDIFQDKLLPAVAGFFNQFKGENAEKWVTFFDNMSSALQKIVDSGVIATVGGFVGDIAVKFSELVNTPAAAWFAGVYLALSPLRGLLSGIAPLLASLFYGLRIAGLVGGGAGAGAAGAGVAGGILSRFTSIAAAAGATLLVVEFLRTKSDTLDRQMSAIYDTAGNIGSKIWDIGTIGVAGGMAQWFAALNGDVQASADSAVELVQKLPWLTEAVQKFVNWGNTVNTEVGKASIRADWTAVNEQFRSGIRQIQTNVGGIGDALGTGRDAIIGDLQAFWTALDQIPLVNPDGTLSPFNDLKVAIAQGMTGVAQAIVTGAPDVGSKISALRDKINQLPAGDPVLGPLRDQMQQQLDNLVKEQNLAQIPAKIRGMVESINGINFPLDQGPLFALRESIVQNLTDLSTAIQERSPEVPAKIQAMVALLNQIPADAPPALQDLKTNIAEALRGIGYDVTVAGGQVGSSVDAFGNLISSSADGARAQIGSSLNGIVGTFGNIQWTSMSEPLRNLGSQLQGALSDASAALSTGAADWPAKVSTLLDVLNSIPAGTKLDGLKTQILEQLRGLGVDVQAQGPELANKLSQALQLTAQAGQQGAQGIGTGIAQKLREGSSLTQAEMDTAIAALTGKVNSGLGGTVPAAIAGTGPALSGAMLKATQGIPLTAEEQFALANAKAAVQAAAMPGAITPGLSGVAGTVSTALAPVPNNGSTPFSALGNSLANIVGGFAGKIIPGLNNTAQQPESKFNPIVSSGVGPWLAMSAAIIGAMNAMNASVARVLAAVAQIVVSAWAIIGRANAAGLAGTLDAVSATVAAARIAERATQTVVDQVAQIARLMITISRAVIEAREARDKVAQYATEAAQAVVRAASAASTAAGAAANAASAAANAAASRAAAGAVPAAEGGIFNPTPGGTLTLIAEAGRRERVEPLDSQGLSRRDRAMISYIVSQVAVSAGGAGDTKVVVTLDGKELSGVVSSVVTSRMDTEARQLKQRRRRSA